MSGNNFEHKPTADENAVTKTTLIEALNKVVTAGLDGELEKALVPGNDGWVKRVIASQSHPKEYTYPMIVETAKDILKSNGG